MSTTSPQICFHVIPTSKSRSDSYPDRRKTSPASHLNISLSQLLSMTDRQRHVRRASFGIMFPFAPYLWKLWRKTNNRSLNFIFTIFFGLLFLILFYFLLLPSDRPAGTLFIFLFFLGGRCSVYQPCECIFKGAGEDDNTPAPELSELKGNPPVAPCRAAMSIVCLHTE